MTEKQHNIHGRVEPPRKIYRTCTFESLGPRKDEFLRRVVEAMKERGLEELPLVEPFGHHLGLKDAFRLWDLSLYNISGLQQMVGTDVLLGYDRKNGAHLRIGLRAEPQGKDLRFGYFYTREYVTTLRCPKYYKFILGLAAFLAFFFGWGLFIGMVILDKPFYQAHGLVPSITVLVVLYFIPLIMIYYVVHRREIRPIQEIDRSVLEIAESMGGKQVTPFKKTTVKLED